MLHIHENTGHHTCLAPLRSSRCTRSRSLTRPARNAGSWLASIRSLPTCASRAMLAAHSRPRARSARALGWKPTSSDVRRGCHVLSSSSHSVSLECFGAAAQPSRPVARAVTHRVEQCHFGETHVRGATGGAGRSGPKAGRRAAGAFPPARRPLHGRFLARSGRLHQPLHERVHSRGEQWTVNRCS